MTDSPAPPMRWWYLHQPNSDRSLFLRLFGLAVGALLNVAFAIFLGVMLTYYMGGETMSTTAYFATAASAAGTILYGLLVWVSLWDIADQARAGASSSERLVDQTRAMRQSNEQSAWARVHDLTGTIDAILFSNPGFRRYFYRPVPPGQIEREDAGDYDGPLPRTPRGDARMMTLAEMHLDLFDFVATNISANEGAAEHIRRDSIWWKSRDQWANWVKRSFRESSALREYARRHPQRLAEWYDDRLQIWFDGRFQPGDAPATAQISDAN